jgi:hypothetical protein
VLEVSVVVADKIDEEAIEAVPVKLAVIVPAEKLPDESLNTIVDTVFDAVADE